MNHAQRMRALETEQRFNTIAPELIDAATVLRTISIGGAVFKRGATLGPEILQAIAAPNLRAMCTNGFLEIFALSPQPAAQQPLEKSNAVRSRNRKSRRTRQKRRAPAAEKA